MVMMREPRDLSSEIHAIVILIDAAMIRGDGSGLAALRGRALLLLDPPRPPREAERAQTSIDIELSIWTEAICELLLPELRQVVGEALRDDPPRDRWGRPSPDPWALVGGVQRQRRDRRLAAEVVRAKHAARASYLRYRKTRRVMHLRNGVSHLEVGVTALRRPLCSGVSMETHWEHADRLERALRRALSASAFRFFVSWVRDAVDNALAEVGYMSQNATSEPDHWVSREDWLLAGSNEERAVGMWFVDTLQQAYDDESARHRQAAQAVQDRERRAQDDSIRQDEGASMSAAETAAPAVAEAEDEGTQHGGDHVETSDAPGFQGVIAADGTKTPFSEFPQPDDHDLVMWPGHLQDYQDAVAEQVRRRRAEGI